MLKTLFEQGGKVCRSLGQNLDKIGVQFEGRTAYVEHLNPSTRIVRNAGNTPSIKESAFVAPNATVVGQVQLGEHSSIWYGATVRGDVNNVKIGDFTSIQDNAIVHVSNVASNSPTLIGNNVTIGPSAVVHACTIEDGSIIGTGAQVLDGAIVGKNAMVAAKSIVTKGKRIAPGQLWSGVPAKYVRDLAPEELEFIQKCSTETAELSKVHSAESAKSLEQLLQEQREHEMYQQVGNTEFKPRADSEKYGLFFRY